MYYVLNITISHVEEKKEKKKNKTVIKTPLI